MVHVADHLSVAALEARYEACGDVTSSRHFQTIWLLAKGHTVGQVAAMTSFGQRWIEQLLERYNAFGPPALGGPASGQRSGGDGLEAGGAGAFAGSSCRSPAWRGRTDERQGGALDGGRTGLGLAGAATRLGGVAGDRMVDSEASAAQPEGGDSRGARHLQKKRPTSSSRRRRATPTRRSRRSRPTSTGPA